MTSAGLLISGQTECEEEDERNENGTEEQLNVNLTPPESPSDYMRLLSRSESANDASIIDKLQQTSRKNCSRSLQFKSNEYEDSTLSPSK